MDLSHAIEKHAEWKVRFRTAMLKHESMDAETIGKDNCCELGKWLHAQGRAMFSWLGAYPECVSAHAAFHREAGKVAEAINAKRFSDAEALLEGNTPYANASTAVGVAIMRLKKAASL